MRYEKQLGRRLVSALLVTAILASGPVVAESVDADADTTLQALNRLTEEFPNALAGVDVDEDKRIVRLRYVATQQKAAVRHFVEQHAPTLARHWKLVLIPVKYSHRQLEAVMENVKTLDPFATLVAPVLVERHIDIRRNAVVVGVKSLDPALEQIAKQYFGSAVILRESADDDVRTSRRNDSRPWAGGIEILNSETLRPCSTAFMVRNTSTLTYGMLSAGHCGFGTAEQRDYAVVGRAAASWYTTSLDMAVLTGSSYEPYIFVGSTTSSTKRDVRRTSNGARRDPVVGERICVGGAASGENCNAVVNTLNTCRTISGREQCNITVADHPNGSRILRGGDSGGPVYRWATQAAGVVPMGTIVGTNSAGSRVLFHRLAVLPSPWRPQCLVNGATQNCY